MTDTTARQLREALEYAALMWSRYRDHGDPSDLKAASGTYRKILASADVATAHRGAAQEARANLALALVDAFALTHESRFLDESIALGDEALRVETDDRGRLVLQNTRHVAHLKRYDVTHQPADLEAADDAVRQMARIAPDDAVTLMARGNVRLHRFDATGAIDFLDEAISTFERCATVAGPGHRPAALGALAGALVERFRLRERMNDIARAYEAQNDALSSLPTDSPVRRDHLLGLGNVLLATYEARKEPAALDAAIDTFDAALDGTAAPAPNLLQNVGYARILRYRVSRDERDLTLGILACQQSVTAAGEAPDQPAGRLANLGLGLAERWRLHRDPQDLELARACFAGATRSDDKPGTALDAAANWGALESEAGHWPEAHTAYQRALDAAESLLATQAADTQRVWLHESRGLGARAAYAAARTGEPWTAVLSIERSRAVQWTHALRLATADVARLERSDAALAQRFRNAATRCARAGDVPADAWHALQAVNDDIRQRPGFERWLSAITSDDLRTAVAGDRFVYYGAADTGGVALNVRGRPDAANAERRTATGDPAVDIVWLPMLTDQAVRERLRGPDGANTLGGYLGAQQRFQDAGDNEYDRALDEWTTTLDAITAWLWDAAIAPVLSTWAPGSTVTIVASGALGVLPLHAAWTPDATRPSGRRYAIDVATFTYAPNAIAFAAARNSGATRTADTLAAIENPRVAPDLDLPNAAFEIRAAALSFDGAVVLRGPDADVPRVTAAIARADVIHFSCHGRAEMSAPLTSSLTLAGGAPLTLAEILELRLSGCGLALLSACETAIAGTDLPDEVISLQSALLQAGASSAIATSWAVFDTSAALVAARFYTEWRRNTVPPAEALALAQRWVRDTTNGQKRDWIIDARLHEVAESLLTDLDTAIGASGPDGRSHAGPLHWAAFTCAGEWRSPLL